MISVNYNNLVCRGWTTQKIKAKWSHWIQEVNSRISLEVLTNPVIKAVN